MSEYKVGDVVVYWSISSNSGAVAKIVETDWTSFNYLRVIIIKHDHLSAGTSIYLTESEIIRLDGPIIKHCFDIMLDRRLDLEL